MAYIPKGDPVPIHPWLLTFRFLQVLLAILIVATTAYALSIEGGGHIEAPLTSTLIAAILTLVPILPLTAPLHISQRRLYDPRIALMLDLVASLFWLASFAVLASYLDVFNAYRRGSGMVSEMFEVCGKCRGAWRSGVAAAVFAALEFLLFLFTTFVHYYHCHLAREPAYSTSGRKSESVSDSTYAPYTPMIVAAEHYLRLSGPYMHGDENGHLSPAANHGTAPIPHPRASDYGGSTTSQLPPPNYGAAAASDTGASPASEVPVSPTSPPLPPRSSSRLERYERYGTDRNSYVGPVADTMRL